MTREEIIGILQEAQALLEGHFLLTSGKHSDRYIQCAQVLQYPEHTAKLCQAMAAPFQNRGITTVVGPAMGGILVAYEVARQLGAKAIFTEREQGKMALRRNFSVKPGEKVLVVEDVVTTGGSVKEVIELLKELGAEVVGAACLVQRSLEPMEVGGVPLTPLLSLAVAAYEPEQCPLCQEGTPAIKPGSRN
ncbi:MAG: orotate phosphoribosyltransferase [Clostridia bacterium]|nr:orotate phosphoribosyltransferase [Clostridia bacterium]